MDLVVRSPPAAMVGVEEKLGEESIDELINERGWLKDEVTPYHALSLSTLHSVCSC